MNNNNDNIEYLTLHVSSIYNFSQQKIWLKSAPNETKPKYISVVKFAKCLSVYCIDSIIMDLNSKALSYSDSLSRFPWLKTWHLSFDEKLVAVNALSSVNNIWKGI